MKFKLDENLGATALRSFETVVPLDGSSDLQVCADSVNKLLYRFWIENEAYYASGQESGGAARLRVDAGTHGPPGPLGPR